VATWFWLNVPLALLFVCCWAGIPLWHTLRRWNAELDAKHAEVAAQAVAAAAVARPDPAVVPKPRRPAHAGASSPLSS
jgi:hypothetical protein